MTSSDFKYLMAMKELYDEQGGALAGIRLTELALRVGVSKASTSRAADRLENGGYLRRDERGKLLITAHGMLQLAEYRILIQWLGGHLQVHCEVPGEIAFRDAVEAVCALSDESRHGLAAYIELRRDLP